MSLSRSFRILAGLGCALVIAQAEPKPGDIFREFTFGTRFSEVDPGTKRENLANAVRQARADRILDVTEFRGATRAEVVVEYWGGHGGTGGQAFRINDHDWIAIPQPVGTPTQPQCYYRTLLRATVEVPLDQLKGGANRFQFRAEPQICHGFDWGFYWVYAFTARVYYDGSRAHPTGEILSHEDGGRMGEFPRFVVDARSVESPIQRVDVIANYEDFNWEGDGIFRQWHYIMERGQLKHHVGSAFAAPWAVNWDTEWIPDQNQPVEVAARITDNTGLTYLTPSRKLKFERNGRSVKMYKAKDVPEVFGVRVGRRLSCNIPIDGKLEMARNARLVLSTWSAAHDGEISINKKKLVDRIGLVHNYSFDSIPVQAKTLKAGDNTFEIFSNTREHAPEVNWPGPVLLVEYTPPPMKPGERKWLAPEATHRMEFDVDPAGYDRRGTPVEVELNAKGLAPVRLIDLSSGAAVPFQSEPGRIVFLLPEMREARKFQVYLGKPEAKQAASPFKITDDVEWAGQKSFRIETPSTTYLYQKEGAGFASLLDPQGRDWITYKTEGGSSGRFRGIPNLGNEFAHPGRKDETGADSRIVAQGPVRVRIFSERHDKTWACWWDFYQDQARMTLLKNGAPYWFLYEGTPAGALDTKDGYFVLSNGERHSLAEQWSANVTGPKWAYFASPASNSMLFVASHQSDREPDQYWPMENNMTVFGFGRQYTCCGMYLNRTPAVFSIGLIPTSSMDAARDRINGLTRDVVVRKMEIEARAAK